ncbi:MAG: hypothetical protein NC433_02995 [Clostridiales bacterium]|nr:hypothetical protein [Clostridiales bacterium]
MLKNHEELIEKLKAVYGDNGFYYVLKNWYKDYLSECKKTFSLFNAERERLFGCIGGSVWALYGANLISDGERKILLDELSNICVSAIEQSKGGVAYGESLN